MNEKQKCCISKEVLIKILKGGKCAARDTFHSNIFCDKSLNWSHLFSRRERLAFDNVI